MTIKLPESPSDCTVPAWQELTCSGKLLDELHQLVKQHSVRGVEILQQDLQKWASWFIHNDSIQQRFPYVSKQWLIIQKLFRLAELAAAQPESRHMDAGMERACLPAELNAARNWEFFYHLQQGHPRPEEGQGEKTRVLLVDVKDAEGVTADLTVHLIPDGTGAIYPCPVTNTFLITDAENNLFDEAINTARQFLQNQGIWKDSYDIRWQLKRDDKKPMPTITGNSMGGAFALILWKLFTRPAGCELEDIACSAAIDVQGAFGKVGGIWKKLWPKLRLVLVANEQDDVAEEYRQERSTPYVVKVASFKEAREKVIESQKPRMSMLQEIKKRCGNMTILQWKTLHAENGQYPKLYQMPLVNKIETKRPAKDKNGSSSAFRSEKEQSEKEQYDLDTVLQKFSQFITPKTKTAVQPRFVLLGEPGSGKTSCINYLAYSLACGKIILDKKWIPASIRLPYWERWARGKINYEWSDYLAHEYRTYPEDDEKKRAALWRCWLEQGRIFFILDGLDEIRLDAQFSQAVTKILNTTIPIVVTCRTSRYGQLKALGLPVVFRLADLDATKRNLYIQNFPADTQPYNPDVLIQQIDASPAMQELAKNPLLLSIICYLADGKVSNLPAQRVDFYGKAMAKLWERIPRRETQYPLKEPAAEEKIKLLKHVAWASFNQNQRQLIFPPREMLYTLKRAFSQEGYGEASAPWANAFLEDCIHNSGLIQGDEEQGYFFLHLTFQEYLAAAYLAEIINAEDSKGWNTEVQSEGKKVTIQRLLDRKAWDPDWQEVILFLAGLLKDPRPLLENLRNPNPTQTNPEGDDYFRHRLTLAALCLGEFNASQCPIGKNVIDQITTDFFDVWWKQGWYILLDFSRPLRILACANGSLLKNIDRHQTKSLSLVDALVKILAKNKPDSRKLVLRAMHRIGPVQISADSHNILQTMASNQDDHIRLYGKLALKYLGYLTDQEMEHSAQEIHEQEMIGGVENLELFDTTTENFWEFWNEKNYDPADADYDDLERSEAKKFIHKYSNYSGYLTERG